MNTTRARRINRARQAWHDLPGFDTTWGLSMRAKIARYFGVTEREMLA